MYRAFFRKYCTWVLFCLALGCGQAFAEAEEQPVTCTIMSGGKIYRPANCLVTKTTEDGYNLYFIERKDAQPLLEEILSISVVEVTPEEVEVRGLTQSGVNSRWGQARRDGDCWAGSDFRICVGKK